MGGFNPTTFRGKLETLNSTQASIETLSNWCQFYRKQAQAVVSCWDAEFLKAPPPRRLLMLYLANDILQNSRKKGPEFQANFFNILPRSLKHALRSFDESARGKVNRLVAVWDDRKVFGNSGARTIKDLLAEAETPRKRVPSGRNASQLGGGPSSSAEIPAQLSPLVDAFQKAHDATKSSAALAGRCAAVLQRGLMEDGTSEQLSSAADLLRHYSTALDGESTCLNAANLILEELVAKQRDALERVSDAHTLAARQLSTITSRLAAVSAQSRPQEPAPPLPPSANSHAVSQSRPEIAASVPPLPLEVAPSLPGLSSTQPPLPLQTTMGSSPMVLAYQCTYLMSAKAQLICSRLILQGLSLRENSSADDGRPTDHTVLHSCSGFSIALPRLLLRLFVKQVSTDKQWRRCAIQDYNVDIPGASNMRIDSSQQVPPLPSEGHNVGTNHHQGSSQQPPSEREASLQQQQQLPQQQQKQQQQQQQQNGSNDAIDDGEAATAAAALVAQLSAAQDSQALLEALAALPQDQQREISLNFLNSSSMTAPAVGANLVGEEEEYDPEDAAF